MSGNINVQLNGKVPWKISDIVYAYLIIFVLSLLTLSTLIFFKINSELLFFTGALQLFLSIFTLLIVFLIVRYKYKIPFFTAMGINKKNFSKDFLTGFSVSFILVVSTTLVSYFFVSVGIIPEANPYTDIPRDKIQLISVFAVFVAPIVEEVFFRGFMQPALIKAFGIFGGIFITSLIFGFSHSQYLDYTTAIVAVTAIGLILGTTRQITGSIVPCIFAHLFNNLFATLSLY
ncbi:MAG: type II CAAX endopeptidase family protein [Candidatus Gastranaerophilales bacterium]|nr:type II CAAX endopeptidase family protein [Candidatus Gastranaerophilales bacterium]